MEAAVPECLWIQGKHRFRRSGLDETKSYKGAGDWLRQQFMRQSRQESNAMMCQVQTCCVTTDSHLVSLDLGFLCIN